MLAFYVWTNIQLVTATNIKVNHYPEEKADLYVLSVNAVSQELIQAIKSQNVFQDVYYLEHPRITMQYLKLGRIPKIRMLFYGSAYRRYYQVILSNYLNYQEKRYTLLFTPGYWQGATYLIDFFLRISPRLEVIFMDEGTFSYYAGKKLLSKYTIARTGPLERLKRRSCDLGRSRKFRRLVRDEIFLYAPEIYHADSMTPKPVPPVNEDNLICQTILESAIGGIGGDHLIAYEKRDFYYIATYAVKGYEDNYNNTYHIIDSILEVVGSRKMIIKPHIGNTPHRTSFGTQYEPSVYVDRDIYLFEALCSKLDLNNKVFITRTSSSVLYPRFMLGKEPFVIFTFRLYDIYYQKGEKNMEQYAADLKSLYCDKSKVLIPNTIRELKEMLTEVYRRIVRY